jgi:hypothetical protein
MKKFNLIFLSILLLSSYQEVVFGDFTSNQELRFALLIGNQAYTKGRLDNPHNDVDDMETALKSVGFQVRKLKDQSLWQMEQAKNNKLNIYPEQKINELHETDR